MDSLNNIDFKKLASQQKSIQMKMRLLALAHFKDGHSRTKIAKFLKVSRTSVNKWVQTFLEKGLEANQFFADYEDIVSKVCRAWNSFLECSTRVRQMCSRRWIELTR
ncbi:hypothetical protein CCZ37_00595 [Vibrio qinghaiensis]|uniref:Uncharacterized protein n=1 Tax=Vibrio qinghaiensis TaxID=2025808 RepID=A0A223MUG1_9VIBR|nr:hypothetical protein CCZ37_00595 [Vibrio qinghaiensis]